MPEYCHLHCHTQYDFVNNMHDSVEFEQQLSSLVLVKPSGNYVVKGQQLLKQPVTPSWFSWQNYITAAMAFALLVSLTLNLVQFNSSESTQNSPSMAIANPSLLENPNQIAIPRVTNSVSQESINTHPQSVLARSAEDN